MIALMADGFGVLIEYWYPILVIFVAIMGLIPIPFVCSPLPCR